MIGFLSGMKNHDSSAILIPFNQFIDSGKLILWEIQDILTKRRIKFLLDPRHILTDRTNP